MDAALGARAIARVRELGVDVRWGHELIGVQTRSDGASVDVSGPDGTYTLETTYLVGADGGRSTVRKLAGIDFPGHTSNTIARIAHVRVPDEMRGPNSSIDVPGVGPLPFGHNRLDSGGFIYAEFESERSMVGTIEFDEPGDDSEPMTLDELRDSARRVLGVDLPVEPPPGPGPHALRRIAGQNAIDVYGFDGEALKAVADRIGAVDVDQLERVDDVAERLGDLPVVEQQIAEPLNSHQYDENERRCHPCVLWPAQRSEAHILG